MGWGSAQDDYQTVQNEDYQREGKLSHEVLAGAGAFGAFKVFEDRQRAEGKVVNHAFAKELLAGIVGGEVDKLVETKGLDYVDREKAKRHARDQAEQLYDEHYGDQDQYDPNSRPPPQHLRREFGEQQWN